MTKKIIEHRHTLPSILIMLSVILGLVVCLNSANYAGNGCAQDNVYQIFKYSHIHLLSDQDLYSIHEDEHCYTYKYSPAFALCFGLFANLSDSVGIVLWLLLSGVVSAIAISSLNLKNETAGLLFFLVIAFEWVGSLQGQQTNVLIAMLLLLAFHFLESRSYLQATLLIAITTFIKIFGLAAIALYIFYPRKGRLVGYSIIWGMILAILPITVLSCDELSSVYISWYNQITGDYVQYSGMSFYASFNKLTGIEVIKPVVLGISFLLLLSPLAQFGK